MDGSAVICEDDTACASAAKQSEPRPLAETEPARMPALREFAGGGKMTLRETRRYEKW